MASYGAMIPAGHGSQTAPSSARHPVLYQIDFTAVASGKHIASTKRRVRWRFGFANPEALAAGETGTACRGEEHDITLVWSVTSGKKLLLADGHEIHCSTSRGSTVDFSWTMKGNHVLKILAHASPPLTMTPGWRQYDLSIDGMSFFAFPKVFRLGLAGGDARGDPHSHSNGMAGQVVSRGGVDTSYPARGYSNYTMPPPARIGSSNHIASIEAPRTPAEEDMYLQEAIKNSIQEVVSPPVPPTAGSASQSGQEGQNLLLDFFDQPPAPARGDVPLLTQAYYPPNTGPSPLALPPSTNATYQFQPTTPSYNAPGYSAPPSTFFGDSYGSPPPTQFSSPPVPPAGYGAPDFTSPQAQATPSSLGFTSPQAQAGGMFQQFDTHANGSAQQFGAPPASPYGATPFPPPQQPSMPSPYGAPAYEPGQQYSAFPPSQSFGGDSTSVHDQNGYERKEEVTSSVIPETHVATDAALFTMNKLSVESSNPFGVNTSAGVNPGASLADQAFSKFANMDTFELVSKREEKRANPFEASSIGENVSLAEMKKSVAPKKDIMRSPTAAPVAPGALVVAGQQTGNWGGGYEQYSAPPQQYSQPSPAHGQQPQPAYGQPTPSYGQQTQPVYVQPSTSFGQQPQPAYGQPSPSYGQQPQPVYVQPSTSFGQQPQPAYSQPSPAYGQPSTSYGQQTQPVYVQPSTSFGQQPQPAYGQPSPSYGQQVQPAYGQPVPGYSQTPPTQQQPGSLQQAATEPNYGQSPSPFYGQSTPMQPSPYNQQQY